ncbi:MAG: FAD-dependent oxidoreductase [Polyangiales bacterium]
MTSPHALVVGGGYAGALAANRLAHRLPRGARVTLVSDRDDLVHRVRLHEALAGVAPASVPLDELLAPGVERVRARVARIDAAARAVTTERGDVLSADALVVALGSALSAPVSGAREHAAGLASPESAARGAAALRALPDGAPVVVVGGGLTALEAATEIADAHPRLAVTLVASTLAPSLSPRAVAYVREALAALGVSLREGAVVRAISARDVTLDTGESLPAAFAVWAGGFVPAGPSVESDLARDGVGRFVVDADLGARGKPGVFVVGDAAAPPPGMDFLRMSCAAAMPMGAQAADNAARLLAGRPTQAHRFGFAGQCVSLGRARGLVQLVASDDRPLDRVITGRAGAAIKEAICRFVVGMIRVERRVGGAYRWPRALPAAEALA